MEAIKENGYIKINGNVLPQPKRGVEAIVTTIVNSGRNANGVLVGQKIGSRDLYKLNNLEWQWLSADEWSKILSYFENFLVDVSFQDPIKNKEITIEMYCGDRSAEPYYLSEDYKPTYYRHCRLNLIDAGKPIKK